MLFVVDSLTAYLPQDESKANRIFYLSVPQEALLDVATSLAVNAQTKKGWNRVIIEKPFGFNPMSSHQLTQSLLSSFQEDQLYRWDDTLFVWYLCTQARLLFLFLKFVSG